MNSSIEPVSWEYGSYLQGFREVVTRLEDRAGFELIPVEVQGPDVAFELTHWLEQHHWMLHRSQPSTPEAWSGLASWILEQPTNQNGVVMVVGRRPDRRKRNVQPQDPLLAGLQIVNLQRDAIAKRLTIPLLWVGPREFLDLTWRAAPDFASLHGLPIVCQPSLLDPPPSVPPVAQTSLTHQLENDIRKGAWLDAAHGARRLAKLHLQEGNPAEALRHIDRLLGSAVDEVPQEVFSALPANLRGELLLLRAEANVKLYHSVAAAWDLQRVLGDKQLGNLLRARAFLVMGRLHEHDGKFDDAVAVYKRAHSEMEGSSFHTRDPRLDGLIHMALGKVLARNPTELKDALPALEHAVDVAEAAGDDDLEVQALATLATVWGRHRDGQEGRVVQARIPEVRAATNGTVTRETRFALEEAADVLLVGPPPPGPAQPAGLPYDRDWYVRRPEEEARALRHLEFPGAAIGVWGPDNMGKSTFVGRLLEVFSAREKELGRTVQVVEVDMREVARDVTRSNSLAGDAFFTAVATRLVRSFGGKMEWVDELHGRSRMTWQEKLEVLLDDYLLAAVPERLVLVFREVQDARSSIHLEDFLILLRHVCEEARTLNGRTPLRILVTFNVTPARLARQMRSSPLTNLAVNIEMRELHAEQISALASLYELEGPASDVQQLLDKVGGHPLLVRSVLHHAVASKTTLRSLLASPDQLLISCADYLELVRTRIEELGHLELVRKLIEEHPSMDVEPEAEDRLSGMGVLFPTEARRAGQRRLLVRMPLLMDYLRSLEGSGQ